MERIKAEVMELRVPKAEPDGETHGSRKNGQVSCKTQASIKENFVQQLKVPKAELGSKIRGFMKESQVPCTMPVSSKRNRVQQLQVPKAVSGTETPGSLKESMPMPKGGESLQQLRVPKLEKLEAKNFSPQRGVFSPKCVLGPNLINLSSTSSSSSSEDESESEFKADEDSSDHSDRSDSDEDEYKASEDDEEEEEGRPSPAKKQKITTSEGKKVRSDEECPEAPRKKCRVKFTAKCNDSVAPRRRTSNPGRRKVGGRIYDSEFGRTCHWCRQKTVELHVECALCPIRFCGACLHNRNGETIELEMLVRWICPKCRGGCGKGCKNCCNCGPCRKAQGLGPTGQLVNVARKVGFSNVHDYLVHQKTKECPEEIALRKNGREWTRSSGALVKSSIRNLEVKQEEEEDVKEEEKEGDVEEEEEDMEEEEEEEDANRTVAVSQSSRTPSISIEVSRRNRVAREFSDFSGSQFTPKTPPVNTPFRKNSAEDIGTEESSQDSGSYRMPFSCTPQSDFAKDLEAALRRPFSTHQLKEMWEHANYRKPVMKTRHIRSRTIEVPSNHVDGRSYLDHYADLGTKLEKVTSPEGKLRLLRGFFFWLQHSCQEGAYRPWRDAQIEDDTGDCTEIEGPDCQIIRVLLAIDEDEENAPPEWEDKKPVIRVEAKKLQVPKECVSTFPVKVKQEQED